MNGAKEDEVKGEKSNEVKKKRNIKRTKEQTNEWRPERTWSVTVNELET